MLTKTNVKDKSGEKLGLDLVTLINLFNISCD